MNENLKNRFKNNTKPVLSGMTVSLTKEVVIKEIPAHQIKVTTIEILSITDDSVNKKVTAKAKQPIGDIVLWEGAAYDAIGQWTDADVIARLNELYVK